MADVFELRAIRPRILQGRGFVCLDTDDVEACTKAREFMVLRGVSYCFMAEKDGQHGPESLTVRSILGKK